MPTLALLVISLRSRFAVTKFYSYRADATEVLVWELEI